ncbi:MAG TPA: glycoside hydrolase family 6 protein [Oligoflexus sp.]|uniref:glycoside hydrolase family 6 protein n=1 Tax=Oligoflexus sp. TaxID=1971216 RepID=UPI002D5C143F|nr:glycoside hydrolase family 6 protein [Oligoflexus sp.]HYX32680.1 glycoside hydrolase family 6 protein [Oligoflexus sp.]
MILLPPLLLSSAFLINCGARDRVNDRAEASNLSTVRVGELANLPNGEKPVYAKLELKISGVESTSFDKTLSFSKGSGAASGFEDTATKLSYGTYRFLLSYQDAAGKVVYESCSGGKDPAGRDITDEKSRTHVINTASYEPIIQICSTTTPAITPTEPPKKPDADVVIKPTMPTGGSSVFDKNSRFYVDPSSQAASDANSLRNANDPNAPLIDYIAKQGAAVWLGAWSGNVADAVRNVVDISQQQDAWPVLVAYMIPYRDCGLHSAGGLDAAKYLPWITEVANAVGNRKAIVILEPDAVPGLVQKKDNGQLCLTPELRSERVSLIKSAIGILKSKPNLKVFIDAGHSAWLSSDEAAGLLKQVGIAEADGFALNTSNYQSTPANVAYGQKVRSQVGNKGFIVDTSRNGIDPAGNTEWCNPRNRALGARPTFDTGIEGVVAFIWGKRPGESDGACNGGPAAGNWWRDIAIELARNANVR